MLDQRAMGRAALRRALCSAAAVAHAHEQEQERLRRELGYPELAMDMNRVPALSSLCPNQLRLESTRGPGLVSMHACMLGGVHLRLHLHA